MAKVKFDNPEAIMKQLDNMAAAVAKNGAAAVKAGGAKAVEVMQQTVAIREGDGHGHTGHLRDHIGMSSVKYDSANGYSVEVYPQGTREDGERYATVGFVLEYGRSDMAAKPWMRTAMETNRAAIAEAMFKELKK